MTTPEQLNACPFCACTTIHPKKTETGFTFHYCDWCGAEGPFEGEFDGVQQGWNTRAPVSPAVLAELPEVRALADDLASCIAMIQHAIGAGRDVFIEPDTRKKLSEARDRLEAFRAAAIREGRNG